MFCEVSFWLGRCLRAISTVDNKMTRWVIEQSYFLPSLATLFHFSLFPRLFASHFTRETRQMLHPAPLLLSKHLEKVYQPPSSLFIVLSSNMLRCWDSFLKRLWIFQTWQMRCSPLSKNEQLYQSETATSGVVNVSFRINSDVILKRVRGGWAWWLNSDREQGGWLPITEAIRWVHFEKTALVNMRHSSEDKCLLWSHTVTLKSNEDEDKVY